MKAIILAAGEGTRLRPLTDDRPKCLVEVAGRPLLDHQLDVLRQAGINEIHVVAGYRVDRIPGAGIHLIVNERYASTNMVATLFVAEDVMSEDQDLIVSYGDIVYEQRVLEELISCCAPVCLTADRFWRRYWELRMADPLDDAETFKLTDGNRVVELGKVPRSYDEVQAQFMGLIKIRADHVRKLTKVWHELDPKATYDGNDVDNMYMTSFIQHLIDSQWDVRAVLVDNGWLEIDTPEDLGLTAHGLWNAVQG